MHDWKAIVREKLSPLPLSNERAEDVIEEIAQQLETAYDEARRQGASEEEALARAFAQAGDWETLRSRVFRSVEGGLLPVWQQRGVFSPRRFPVWIALLLAFAFLASPGFRQVLTMLPVPRAGLERSPNVVSDTDLRRLERTGNKQEYARALAYVALHSDDNQRAVNAAVNAIALDPQLTWIAAPFSHALEPLAGRDPKPWIQRLEAWDSGNAYPYMLEATALIAAKRKSNVWRRGSAEFRNNLAADSAWRHAMDKASHAARVDFYFDREFALNKEVLEAQGVNRPEVLLTATFAGAFPHVLEINSYLGLLCDEVRVAAKSGDIEEALSKYWTIVRFDEMISAASPFPFAHLRDRKYAFESVLPLLMKAGQAEQAEAIRASLLASERNAESAVREYKEQQVTNSRSAETVFASALCFEGFGLATVLWLFLAALLKWKPNLSRTLNSLASRLCYAPPALAAASLALFLSYFPYARPLAAITSRRELVTTYVPLLARFSTFVANPSAETWIKRMFWPSIWCVAVAVFGVLLLRLHHEQRASRD